MNELFSGFTALDKVFLVCAFVGGTLFVIRLGFQFLGMTHDLDAGTGLDHADGLDGAGLDHADGIEHTADAGHADADLSFKLLTFQGLVAFFMMFGLVGLMLDVGFNVGAILSAAGAFAAGSASLWLIAKAMTLMVHLQSSGNIDLKKAIGEEGTVYLTIPAGGVGKIQVSVQDRLMEFEAEANDPNEIKTGERVRVVFIKSNNLIVEKI
jgi:membrane protein implicated in regulation of membrane protease activity